MVFGVLVFMFWEQRFNPLNQVYVFNNYDLFKYYRSRKLRFNPLNQVYVFNENAFKKIYSFFKCVLIP